MTQSNKQDHPPVSNSESDDVVLRGIQTPGGLPDWLLKTPIRELIKPGFRPPAEADKRT